MKKHRLGSLAHASPEEAKRFEKIYGPLSAWVTDDANVTDEDAGALVNVLLHVAVQVAQQLNGDRKVFLDAVAALWDSKKKELPS